MFRFLDVELHVSVSNMGEQLASGDLVIADECDVASQRNLSSRSENEGFCPRTPLSRLSASILILSRCDLRRVCSAQSETRVSDKQSIAKPSHGQGWPFRLPSHRATQSGAPLVPLPFPNPG